MHIKAFLYGFRISLRMLLKDRKYAILNVSGLAFSLAAALLIFLYLLFETSYDKFHPGHENIYRVGIDVKLSGVHTRLATNSISIGPALVESFPDIVSYTRLFPSQFFFRNLIYRYQDKSFQENLVMGADSTFFDFFSHRFIEGDAHGALREPFSVVLTESMANRYFAGSPALGKTLVIEGAGNFTITAVVSDPPVNTHLRFSGLFSMTTMPHLGDLFEASFQRGATWERITNNPTSFIVWVYVKTVPGFQPQEFLNDKWPQFFQQQIADSLQWEVNMPIFQPIADIHLTSKLGYELTNETGAVTMMSPDLVRTFFLIAIFLLIIASINYTNISISQFQSRAREMGVKKVLGATRPDIIYQIFSESIILTFIAFVIALFLLEVSIPFVNSAMGISLSLNPLLNLSLLLLFFGITVFTAFLSGIYPAMYFSGISPVKILRDKLVGGKKTLGLKKILIIVQFTISVFMVIASLVVAGQLAFINRKDLGFDSRNVMILELKDFQSRASADHLQQLMLQSPHITGAATSNYFPARLTHFNTFDILTDSGPLSTSAHTIQVGNDYMEFMGLKLSSGRFFSSDHPTDLHEAVVINKAAQRLFGWDDPIGKVIDMHFNWPDGIQGRNRKVIGVLNDFHFSSLKRAVEPMVIYPVNHQAQYLSLRIDPMHIASAMKHVESTWEEHRTGYPLIMVWLDQVISLLYRSQQILTWFFGVFASLCIFIAFMGLYGLSAWSTGQRTREIAIRKVLGSSNAGVFMTLGKTWFRLIVFACLLASVLAWYFMELWLAGFAHRITLTIWPFVIAIASAVFLAAFTIYVHTIGILKINSSEILKYE